MDDIMHTFNYPYTIPQALLAKKICDTIGMDKIFYQNSGTEANECMIKMARKYGIDHYGPDKYHIITAQKGFHGRTFGSMAATGQPDTAIQQGFGPMLDGFTYAEYNNLEDFASKVTDHTIAIMIELYREKAEYIRLPRNLWKDLENCAMRKACCFFWMRCRPDGTDRNSDGIYGIWCETGSCFYGKGYGRRHADRSLLCNK